MENQKALLIGNSHYLYNALSTPCNDVDVLSKMLINAGFEVTIKKDITKQEMQVAVTEFKKKISQGDYAVIYFSGHGYAYQNNQFLSGISEDPLEEGLDLSYFDNSLSHNTEGDNLIIVDACRKHSCPNFTDIIEHKTNSNVTYIFSTQVGEISYEGSEKSFFIDALEKSFYYIYNSLNELVSCINNEYVKKYLYLSMNNYNTEMNISGEAVPILCSKGQMSPVLQVKGYNREAEYNIVLRMIENYTILKMLDENNYSFKKLLALGKSHLSILEKDLDSFVNTYIVYRDNLGFFGFFNEICDCKIIDVKKDHFFLEYKYKNTIKNEGLYEYDDLLNSIKEISPIESAGPNPSQGIYIYNSKSLKFLILQNQLVIKKTDYKVDIDLNNYSSQLSDILNCNKKILIVSDIYSDKEILINQLTQFFLYNDDVLILDEDVKIMCKVGNEISLSKNMSELISYSKSDFLEFLNKLNESNFTKFIYIKKAFRDFEFSKDISEFGIASACTYIETLDYCKNDIENSSFDYIIYFNNGKLRIK